MAGYDQRVKVKTKFKEETKKFFKFLQRVGKKYSQPVRINFRYLGRGYFYIVIDGGTGGIDALLQELLLNRGLYYYACTLENKRVIIQNVIIPVFRELVDERFENSHSRFLRKHILGKYAQTDFIPTGIKNKYGYLFEVLFRKWDLKMVSDKDYILDLDAVIQRFILEKIGHIPGEKSPNFSNLLGKVKKTYMVGKEASSTFATIHQMRTGDLHRLSSVKTREDLYTISYSLFRYFSYLDDFEEAQKCKTISWKGKKYRRIKYGDEKAIDEKGNPYLDETGKPIDWAKETEKRNCHDCEVKKGQYHVEGCDAEVCPRCGGQMIGYDCGLPDE
jgi:hypothetical protein